VGICNLSEKCCAHINALIPCH